MTEKHGDNTQTFIPHDGNRSLLEELNVPPAAIKFINENSRNLIVGAVAVVVAILAVQAYGYYTDSREQAAAAMLHEAMIAEDATVRQGKLTEVVEQYSSTGAGHWSGLELAHAANDSGDYATAIARYEEVLHDIPAKGSMAPLVLYGLGHAQERNGDLENALVTYQKLAKFAGFEVEGLLAVARVYELREQADLARTAYLQLSEMENLPVTVSSWVDARLRGLPGADGQMN